MAFSVSDALSERKDRKAAQSGQNSSGNMGANNAGQSRQTITGSFSVSDALRNRQNRNGNQGSNVSDPTSIIDRYNSLVGQYNDSIGGGPSFGVSADDVLGSQRDMRAESAAIYNELDSYRAYLGDDVVDDMLSSLEGMVSGWNDIVSKAKYYSQWESPEDYEHFTYLSGMDLAAQTQAIEDQEAAIADLKKARPGGILGMALHGAGYYSTDDYLAANDDIQAAEDQLAQMRQDLYDATLLQQGQQESAWEKQYSGMSYDQLMPIIQGMEEGAERDWLEGYAPSTMTAQDMTEKQAENNTEIYYLDQFEKEWEAILEREFMLQNSGEWTKAQQDQIDAEKEALLQRYGVDSLEAAQSRRETLMAENWELDNRAAYDAIPEAEGFQANSGVPEGYTTGTGSAVSLFDYINDIEGARERETLRMAGHGESPYAIYDFMDDQQIGIFNYLYNVQGMDAAEDYLQYIQYDLNAKRNQSIAAGAQTIAQEAGAAASLFSIPAMMMSGLGILDVGMQHLGRAVSGGYAPIDYNRGAMAYNTIGSTIRQTRAQHYNEKGTINLNENEHPILARLLNGRGWGDVYQLGMSLADSYLVGNIGKVTGLGGKATLLLSGSAATQGVLDAVESGASDEQALLIGILNGAAEYLFEKYELDNLLGQDTSYLKAIANQALTEGFGEGMTSVSNALVDYLVMAENSGLEQKAREYMLMGYSESEAMTQALLDIAADIGWDVIGGMVSGAAMSGGFQATQAVLTPADVRSNSKRLRELGMSRFDADQKAAELYDLAQGYGDAAGNFQRNYAPGQDTGEYALEFRTAYEMGKAGADRQRLGSDSFRVMSQSQRDIAYDTGVEARKKAAGREKTEVKATLEVSEDQKTVRTDTGKEVKIDGFASVGDKATLKVGSDTVKMTDVSYASAEEAAMYETVATVAGSASTANAMLEQQRKSDVSPVDFANGLWEAYEAGRIGSATRAELGQMEFAGKLPLAVRNIAYSRGIDRGRYQANAAEAVLKAKGKQNKGQRKEGKLHFDRKGRTFSDIQETGLAAMESFSKALGIQVYVYESFVKNGERVYKNGNGETVKAPNGFYDPETGAIHIDLNAGNFGQGTMLFTLAHELTHYIKQWSPVRFRVLTEAVLRAYSTKGQSVNALVEKQMAKAKESGRNLTPEQALEEVVADSMEAMLVDGSFGKVLADIKARDKTLWQKIKDWLLEIADKLKKAADAYRGMKPDSVEGRMVREMDGVFDEIQKLFAEGLVEASENFAAAEGQKNTTQEGGVKYSDKYLAAEVDPNVLNMVTQVTSGNYSDNDKVELGKVPDDIAAKIKEITGVDPSGFRIVIEARQMLHILNGHGSNGDANRSMKDPNDIARIKYVIFTPDDIRGPGMTRAYTHQRKGKARPAPTVLYEKNIGEKSYYVVQAVPDTKAKTVYIVSAFIGPSGYKKEASQLINASNGPDATAKPGSVVASKNSIRKAEAIVNPKSVEAMDLEVDEKTESVAPTVMMSERTWTQSEYVQERDMAALAISKAIGVSIQKAKDYIDSVNSIAKMIADDRTRLDYFSSPGRSSFIGNVEYGGSFDFSTLCKKRRLLTGTFTAIQKALPNTALTANEILEIRKRMQDAGLEVSCGLCYVEGSRANMGQFAKEFLRLYKQYYPDGWQPNMADVNTPEGIEWVRINHPEVYEQYEYFWNHYGTLKPGDKNLFASQQKPKLYQLHTEYKGEILQKFRNDDNVEEKNINGGIRLQSFSDFEIVHLIDTMQIIMDMSLVGLAGQAYTKVPDFAWALGDTGLKINLSLIAKGVDENGNLIFDDVEGMPIQEAMRLRERYSENVGTILVAFNDAQLKAAMADPRVDFIIPFHRSQWKKSQYEAMGLPKNTKDYTYMQNEKYIKPQYHEYRGRMVRDKATNYMPNEYWDFSKSGTENARAYLEMCARNNKRPKFYKLLTDNKDGSYSLKEDGSTDGYWKLLIDFKMYDNQGNGSPQRPVTPEFNMEEANRMLNDYRGGHSSFPVAQGIADQFVAEYKESHKGKVLSERDTMVAELERQNAALQEDVEELKKLLALQGQVTGGRIPKKSSVEAAAKWLKGYAGATMDADDMKELAGMLTEFYGAILNDEELAWESVMEKAAPIADFIQARVNVKPQMSEYSKDVLRELRGRKIKLSDSQKAEAARAYGSYNEYRKAAFGSVTLSNEGIPLDSLWQEMASIFPGTFDENVTAGDQPAALLEVIQGLRSTDQAAMEYEYNREFIRADLIRAVYDSFWRVDTLKTVADKNQKKVNELKAKHRQQMDTLRQEKNKAIQRVKKQWADDIEKVRREMRQEIRDRVTATEKRYQESRAKATEQRRTTAGKKRVRKLVAEIRSLYEHGTKERNVKKGMRDFVEHALAAAEVLFMDNYTDEDIVMAGVSVKLEDSQRRLLDRTQELIRKRDDVFKGGKDVQTAEAVIAGDTAELDALQERYDALQEQINKNLRLLGRVLRAERARLNETTITAVLEGLAEAYKQLGRSDDNFIRNGTYETVYQGLMQLIEDVRGTTVKDMTSDQLEAVERAFKEVLHTIRAANKAFVQGKKETIAELGEAAVREVKAVGGFHEDRNTALDPVRRFWWNNLKPVYAMKRIGSKVLTDAYNAIRRGEDTWARDIDEARRFFQAAADRYGYDQWDQEKGYVFKTPNGQEFTLTLGQMMSIYAYSKRQNAKDHLRIGGIVFDPNQEVYRDNANGKRRKRSLNDATAYQIGEGTVAAILEQMTKEQIAFVDEMQKYLSETMGAKGNEVSNVLYGVDLFGEENYFPMKSARQYLFEQNQPAGEVSLKNSGFTKAIQPGANNPLILGSFMDVWSQHVNRMSTYHGFALPIEDFNRIFNYQTGRNEEKASVSVKAAIQGAYSPAAIQYISRMLTDINGGARTDPAAGVIGKMMSLFKKGAVFASLSVAIQQPSAIGRAAALIDPKWFSGKKVTKQNIEQVWEECKEYAPVALIKEMGFFDTSVGKSTQDYITARNYKGLKNIVKGFFTDASYRDEQMGMLPALLDNITWANIWQAVKREQLDKHPDADPASEEFLKRCGERFTEIVTETQVYDSVLSRSANMRSKDTGMQMLTAFMAEPTTSMNMLSNAVVQARRGDKKTAGRAVGAVVAAQIINSILVSLVYAARDDDEEQSYAEKYLEALANNIWNDVFLMVPNSIPFISDIMSMLQGYDVERSDMAVISDMINAIQQLSNEKKKPWQKVELFVGSLAQIFGLPVKNILRDVKAIYNVADGMLFGERSTAAGFGYAVREGITGDAVSNAQQLYDARVNGDKAHEARVTARYENQESADAAVRNVIKRMFMAGEIDRVEAQRQLMLYAGYDNAVEIYWLVDAWVYEKDTGSSDGYGKYNDIYAAMLAGESIDALMTEFTDLGYREDDVLSQMKKEVGRWYYDDESETRIGRDQAVDMLGQYFGMDEDEIAEQMRSWDMRMETGFSYSELKGEYMEGNVSREEALRLLQEYGLLHSTEAEDRVADWDFEAEHGFGYDDIRHTYQDGEITAAEAIDVMMGFGGKDREDAEYAIRLWDFETKNGWAYESRVSLYKQGRISGDVLQKALIEFGGYTPEDARTQVEVYDWEMEGIKNVTITRVERYHEFAEPAGISKAVYMDVQRYSADTKNDVDPDTGKSINYSAMKKVMAYIDSLPLTEKQKDAMAYSLGWSKKNIEKYKPW